MVAPFVFIHFRVAEEVIPLFHRVLIHNDRRGHMGHAFQERLKAHLVNERDFAITRLNISDGEPVVPTNVARKEPAFLIIQDAHLFSFVGHELHWEHAESAAGLALKSIHRVAIGIRLEPP